MHYMVHEAIRLPRKSANCVCVRRIRVQWSTAHRSCGPASSISVSSPPEISPSKSPPALSTGAPVPAIYFAPR
ncbi:hypothetical protein CEXT_294131 [Caerostris extrusa]|uniref:Uncharacterized protein n=1 Tax=Caerostris extrusa TaxID=172846 RepID=A0AAV4UAA1_CAEEX|nr:hypothetical protein CEXT_294131 [Caerostris extrusa]